jgi:hypothetical protein
MNVLVAKTLKAVKNFYFLTLEYASIAIQWKLKFIRIQLKKWTGGCCAKKELDKAYGKLGAEIFALHKAGHNDWKTMPLVEQKLKIVEEAESKLFSVDGEIDSIVSRYQAKKAAISEKYQAKRADAPGA